ncbi:oxidoreductase [Sphaerotilus microaerophilus]|uniref:Oxidoreductase n=1 Tax=Sphaerotilus microaerophilus TaxID=2914710 RepID=A0ABN6PM91_9BURK|nr:oxidoreductase [Sphaerotilus sp. FB-5]BDI05167.1 oxidoreductase [Sphaerotilus sp. FB-5]
MAPDASPSPTLIPTTARPLRVGLVGWGASSQVFHAPLITTTPGLELVGVVCRRPEVGLAARSVLGEAVQVHAEPQALFERGDVDLVVIPTPNDSHHPLALAALRAGKAVVVDKPFTLDAAQARELIDEAERRQCLLSVFHNRRWDGDLLTARALLRSGRLGRLVHASLHFDRYRPVVPARWREAGGPGSGLWMDLGPHLLDQALQLFGAPVAIAADLACMRDGAVADDGFHARLRWADGLRADLHASTLAAVPGPRFALHGTLGSWVKQGLDRQEDDLKAGQRPDPARPADWGQDPSAGRLVTAADPQAPSPATVEQPWPNEPGRYPAYYAGIRDALLGLAPNPVPATEALAVMQLLDLGRLSAAERRELPCDGIGLQGPAGMGMVPPNRR